MNKLSAPVPPTTVSSSFSIQQGVNVLKQPNGKLSNI
jgi:hypothetical protein